MPESVCPTHKVVREWTAEQEMIVSKIQAALKSTSVLAYYVNKDDIISVDEISQAVLFQEEIL